MDSISKAGENACPEEATSLTERQQVSNSLQCKVGSREGHRIPGRHVAGGEGRLPGNALWDRALKAKLGKERASRKLF